MFNRKTHWENIYQDNAPQDVSWHQQEPFLSLQFIQNTGLRLDEPIIDVGGGASLLVDYLLSSGYLDIGVLDISEHALANTKTRLGEATRKINWYAIDITKFKPPRQYALWHDRAVFHFLTAEPEREQYIQVLNQSLRTGGHLIIAAFATGGPQKCSGLDIVQYNKSRISAELGQGFDLVEEADELHITPTNVEQKFSYFRFIKN